MKISNTVLAIAAAFSVGAVLSLSVLVISKKPSAVTYIPKNDDTSGGGLAFEMPSNPTYKQAAILDMAYEIAVKDGHKYPQLLQGILLQESLAGGLKSYKVAGPENSRYYGVGQIKVAAARDVLVRWPEMWNEFNFHTSTDEEIMAKLIENPRFNISVASKYLLVLQEYGFTTPTELAIAYNKGPGGARTAGPTTDYSIKVLNHAARAAGRNTARG